MSVPVRARRLFPDEGQIPATAGPPGPSTIHPSPPRADDPRIVVRDAGPGDRPPRCRRRGHCPRCDPRVQPARTRRAGPSLGGRGAPAVSVTTTSCSSWPPPRRAPRNSACRSPTSASVNSPATCKDATAATTSTWYRHGKSRSGANGYGRSSPAMTSPSNGPGPGRNRPTLTTSPNWNASRKSPPSSSDGVSRSTSSGRCRSAHATAPAGPPATTPTGCAPPTNAPTGSATSTAATTWPTTRCGACYAAARAAITASQRSKRSGPPARTGHRSTSSWTTCRRTRPPPSAGGQPGTRSSCVSPRPARRGPIRSKRQFGPLRMFTMANSDYPNHVVLARDLHAYLRWRNANARHLDVITAQRRERVRVRSERHQRWGRPHAQAA